MPRLIRALHVFLWSFVVCYIAISSLRIYQVDIWWQLSEGLHLLHSWQLPTEPPAAFGLPQSSYFDEYSGYELFLAAIYSTGGFVGIWFVFAVIFLSIFFVPSMMAVKKHRDFSLLSALLLLAAAILMLNRFEQRPDMIGSLLLVLLICLLRDRTLQSFNWRHLLALFALFPFWTNAHSSFIVGLFVLVLWLTQECLINRPANSDCFIGRKAGLIAGMALSACVLNPYGFRRFYFPFLQQTDPGSTVLSLEMQPVPFGSTPAIVIFLTSLLLLCALLSPRRPPLWLCCFALLALLMSIEGFRYVNFLAVALIFIYTERRTETPSVVSSTSGLKACAQAVTLGLLCILTLLFDSSTLRGIYNELSHESYPGRCERFSASILLDSINSNSTFSIPILCHHGEGAYLTFTGNHQLRPLLDSGLSHFSNETKRYFFFLNYNPSAFDSVLKNLDVQYVLISPPTMHWLLLLRHHPDWAFVDCSEHDMLFKHNTNREYAFTDSNAQQVTKAKKRLLDKKNYRSAFCYSTLIDSPQESLSILSHSNDWAEPFFNYFEFWLDSLPDNEAATALANPRLNMNPVLHAFLFIRSKPQECFELSKMTPDGVDLWIWKALQIKACLKSGHASLARQLFNEMPSKPVVSLIYPSLIDQLHVEEPDYEIPLNSLDQWQSWDNGGADLMQSVSGKLNQRIDSFIGRVGY